MTHAERALLHFEADPAGAVAWLAKHKQPQPREFKWRWVAVIQNEARERVKKAEGEENG